MTTQAEATTAATTRGTDRGAVILTGAAGGIATAIARELAAQRVPLVLVGRHGPGVQRTRDQLPATAPAVVVEADIRDAATIGAAAEDAVRRFGRIDALIACAAAHGPEGDLDAIDLDEVAETFEVNLVGTIVSCRAVLPAMRRQDAGNIVLYSSGAGHVIPRKKVRSIVYQISRFGIEGLVNGLAVQLRGTGINVNGIRPGRTLAGANLTRDIPNLRSPEQSVEPTLFLASLAPGEMTGFVLEAADYNAGFRPARRDYTV